MINNNVSLIMVSWSPTPERFNLLQQTLQSLKNSTDIIFEFIFVDNGPKEQTEFLENQKIIKIDKHLINKENIGIGKALNNGIKASTGNIIAISGNDMVFKKDWLKESIEALEKYPDKKFIMNSTNFSHKKFKKFFAGRLDEYTLWTRSGSSGWVTWKKTFDDCGVFKNTYHTDTKYCDVLLKKGYKHLALPETKAIHVGRKTTILNKGTLSEGKWKYEMGKK